VIYLNGPRKKFSEQEYQEKLRKLRAFVDEKHDSRIIVVGRLYHDNEFINIHHQASGTWEKKIPI
jgi:23S rRNA C2498 (ribose-2'-O)-methylase RlmM